MKKQLTIISILLVILLHNTNCNDYLLYVDYISYHESGQYYVINCKDTNNVSYTVLSFDSTSNTKVMKDLNNCYVSLSLILIPDEFNYNLLNGDTIIENENKIVHRGRRPEYIEIIEYENDTLTSKNSLMYIGVFITPCLNGLNYVSSCNDSTNIKKILNFGVKKEDLKVFYLYNN